jgi:hypothetical protein
MPGAASTPKIRIAVAESAGGPVYTAIPQTAPRHVADVAATVQTPNAQRFVGHGGVQHRASGAVGTVVLAEQAPAPALPAHDNWPTPLAHRVPPRAQPGVVHYVQEPVQFIDPLVLQRETTRLLAQTSEFSSHDNRVPTALTPTPLGRDVLRALASVQGHASGTMTFEEARDTQVHAHHILHGDISHAHTERPLLLFRNMSISSSTRATRCWRDSRRAAE